MISSMMQRVKDMLLLLILAVFSKAVNSKSSHLRPSGDLDCLSWRLGVETNNIRGWRTVPAQCFLHIEHYMIDGQYDRDLNFIMEQVYAYLDQIVLSHDGFDAWILDVDDTCISNIFYYKSKRFGCKPYDPMGFKRWASKGECSSIPAVLTLFNKLVDTGFKVFLLTGRDEETLGQVTLLNLLDQEFFGYERLISRNASHRGQSAVEYKSGVRKHLEVEQGYRIWGNMGDQWSDLQGDCTGNRTFKLPNPMYFVP